MNRLDFNQELYRLFEGHGHEHPNQMRLDAIWRQLDWAGPDALRSAVDELLAEPRLPSQAKLVSCVRRHNAKSREQRRAPGALPADDHERQAIMHTVNDRRLRLLVLVQRGEISPVDAAAMMVHEIHGWHPWAQAQAFVHAKAMAVMPATPARFGPMSDLISELVRSIPDADLSALASEYERLHPTPAECEYHALRYSFLDGLVADASEEAEVSR